MYWITDTLAVSGFRDADFKPVGAVLNVAQDRPYEVPDGLAYLHRGFPDIQPFPIEVVWECVRWVEARLGEGHKVLVHCAEGNSRSVSVVLAYLLHRGHDIEEVKRLVLSKKPWASAGGRPTPFPQYFQEAFLARWLAFLARRA